MSNAARAAPHGIVDPHFHFLDPEHNPAQHATLLKAHPDLTGYLPEDYQSDFASLNVVKSVHMEVIPDDFVYEVKWVAGLATSRAPWVKAIVAAADPSSPDFAATLDAAAAAAPGMLRGIRWILNYDGELQAGETPTVERATWPRTAKHFLAPPVDATFEANFALLAERGLSFDLQANPHQHKDCAAFLAHHPGAPRRGDRATILRCHIMCI
jgi:predicted TIM-barrel fold metal-dependent hydrolase